jgi:hypothetical protein
MISACRSDKTLARKRNELAERLFAGDATPGMSRVMLMREVSVFDAFSDPLETGCQCPPMKIFLVSANKMNLLRRFLRIQA